MANSLSVIEKLYQEERKIFDKVSSNIKTIYKKYTHEDISEDILLKIFLRMYVNYLI